MRRIRKVESLNLILGERGGHLNLTFASQINVLKTWNLDFDKTHCTDYGDKARRALFNFIVRKYG